MRKRVPQESQATEEVSLTFIQDGANPFEDWLDKKYLDFGFNAPSLSNTWTVQDHMLSVIVTKRYIQTVKEKSPINGSLSGSDDDSYPPRSSNKSLISREVTVQEKNTSKVPPVSSRLQQC